ncbi:hypothetical protein [Glycomyces sp. YM15]|uniref:hypothetical protein n=1 Tax=Glycomyces sp. YM15 TaxID=2800446 RepID=UPI0019657ECD|nr:hypothetical protein [Glycomyces sp. YM15]
MSTCTVMFIDPVDLSTLAQAAAEAFAVPLEQIETWNGRQFTSPATSPGIAQVAASPMEGVSAEFVGFDAFAAHTGGLATLQIAIALATRLQQRALIEPETAEDHRWTLVATNGSYQHVMVDSELFDDGTLAIINPEP